MMKRMDKFDLLKEKLRGNEEIEELPVALWKHFPQYDLDPRSLAEAHMNFQVKFDLDLLKISPHGRYPVIDFGCTLGDVDPITGSRRCQKCRIKKGEDWEEVEEVDVSSGEYGKQLRVYELIAGKLADEVPLLATVFSPFMVASKMDPNLLVHVQREADSVREGIRVLTRVTREYASASLEVGVHGIFLATQHYTISFSESFVNDWENQWISEVIKGVRARAEVMILHLHGDEPRMDLAMQLSGIDGWNWHDQATEPKLAKVEEKIRERGLILGGIGISREKINIQEQYIGQLNEVIKENQHLRHWYLAPGCVLPQWLSDEEIEQFLSVVRFSSKRNS